MRRSNWFVTTLLCCLFGCCVVGLGGQKQCRRHPVQGALRVGGQSRSTTLDVYEYDNQELLKDHVLDENVFSLEYGLTDAVFISARVGSMSWDQGLRGEFEAGSAWGIGLGAELPVYDFPDSDFSISAGLDFFYDHASPDPIEPAVGDPFEAEVEWWETSGSAICSWRDMVFGFSGLRYTQVDLTYTHDSNRGTRRGGFQEDSPLSFFVGAGVFWKNFVAQAQWQLFGNEGYEFGVYYNLELGAGL